MSATSDDLSPSQAEAGAEQARAGLVSTLNQLRENLKPGNVVEEVMTNAKVSASAVTDQIWDTARKNPLPALLIGAGLAMLLGVGQRVSSSRRRVPVSGAHPPDPQNALAIGSRLGSRMPPQGTVSTTGARATRRATTRVGTVQSQASDLLGAANDRLTSVASRGADALKRNLSGDPMSYLPHDTRTQIKTSLSRILDEQPLVLAAIGVAIGAAIGAAIPQTETENSLMGETSHQLRDAAQGAVQDQYAQLRSAAAHAVEDIKQTAADHGVSTENLSGLVHDVGEKAKSATYEAGKTLDPTT